MFDILERDGNFAFLEATMDVLSFRHSLIAGNIANVDTPGYRALDVNFDKELRVAIEHRAGGETAPGDSGALSFKEVWRPVVEESEGKARHDGNTVNIDRELLNLSRVTNLYARAAKFYQMKLKLVKSAIKDTY